jgi:hypothetical protein
MFEKIVRRVPVTIDRGNDLEAMLDIIELELGLFTGGESVGNRLFKVVNDIRQSEGLLSEASMSVLLDVIERLKRVELVLSDNAFDPAGDTSGD